MPNHGTINGERITLKTVRKIANHYWKIFSKFIVSNFLNYLYLLINSTSTILIRLGTLADLTKTQIICLLVAPLPLTILNHITKKNEKESVRKELDIQYEVAFGFAGKAMFDFSRILDDPKVPNIHYINQILSYISLSVESILFENNIETENSQLSANIMVQNNNFLRIIAFGPELPNRIFITLPLDQNNPLPGAPSAFVNNNFQYIKNTNRLPLSRERNYRCFFSIPIIENECDGDVFAILNIDSTKLDHFKSRKFISDRIIPALSPYISLIKILHKLNHI